MSKDININRARKLMKKGPMSFFIEPIGIVTIDLSKIEDNVLMGEESNIQFIADRLSEIFGKDGEFYRYLLGQDSGILRDWGYDYEVGRPPVPKGPTKYLRLKDEKGRYYFVPEEYAKAMKE